MALDIKGIRNHAYGHGISVDNVNEALPLALSMLRDSGIAHTSRGLETLEMNGPVTTIYRTPQRRVLFDYIRDANPFFHLMESMWILAGSDTVNLPAYFLPSITKFSDNGKTFHGAYGCRLRHYRGIDLDSGGPGTYTTEIDQLRDVVELLRTKPDTRQAVLSIWDPALDLGSDTKDVPCNDMIMLSIRDGRLNMTVCNRSNDVILGAYGANVVQFSVLQEWLAAAIGVNVGFYVQQSNSFHVYTENPFWQSFLAGKYEHGHIHNPYMELTDIYPIALNPEEARLVQRDAEVLNAAAEEGDLRSVRDYSSPFFNRVIVPAITAYALYKAGHYDEAMVKLRYVDALDWRYAMTHWVQRRKVRAQAVADKSADQQA